MSHLAVLDHQVAGESLCVALGDEAALVRRHGEDAGRLEGAQLAGGAGRAVDLQLLARTADLLPVELRQSLPQDLRQAQPKLATHAANQSFSSRVVHLVREWGWVDYNWHAPPFCLVSSQLPCTLAAQKL